MKSGKVISREYKLVLKTENFTGNEFDVIKKAKLFGASFKKVIQPFVKTSRGNLDTISVKREIRFYDTRNFKLQDSNFIFRERRQLSDDEKEITLKFRHPDRYVSQDRNMKSQKINNKRMKLEEDIKAPFITLYSYSSSGGLITMEQEFKKMKTLVKFYPSPATHLNNYLSDEEIVSVSKPNIEEITISSVIILNKFIAQICGLAALSFISEQICCITFREIA